MKNTFNTHDIQYKFRCVQMFSIFLFSFLSQKIDI